MLDMGIHSRVSEIKPARHGMRTGFFAVLILLFSGARLVFGEHPDAISQDSTPEESLRLGLSDKVVARAGANVQSENFGLWISAEALLWWIKSGHVPPLVTARGNGVIGSPGTQVLLDDLNFVDDFRQGGRFALGYRFESNPAVSIEASGFFLPDADAQVRFASSGPIRGRPYIDVATGKPAVTLIASPGIAAGSVTIAARTSLWGTEANLSLGMVNSDHFHVAALAGFRSLSLEDEINIDEQFKVARSVPGFGGNRVNLRDDFNADNCFYGGQLGVEAGVRFRMVTIDFRGKLGVGQMQQEVDISGATHVLRPNGSTTLFEGGLLALRSNIGDHQRNELAVVPELGVNVGLQLTRYLNVYAGYTFLWVSDVSRAGEQMDPVVNVTQFPILSGNHPLVGPARPGFHFAETDFWAQGMNFGLQLRF